MSTWKQKYNKKYGFDKDESHSLSDISKKTGVSKKGLQQIYNKGIGAWKTNLPSVRLKGSFKKNKNTKKFPRSKRLGKDQWAMARVYSAVMGGKASKVDAKELKMESGGIIVTPLQDRINDLKFILQSDRFGRSAYELGLIETEIYNLTKQSFRQGGNIGVDNSNKYIKGNFDSKINWSEYYENGGIMDETIRASLFDEDGERKIDPQSIELLTNYVNSLPQTKSMHFDEKSGRYTPDRRMLHKNILDSFKDSLVCIETDEPIAILMGGSPASGKSSFLRKYAPYLLSTELLRIDADEVRAMLPEYEGWNASQTHLETKDIVNTLLSDRTIGLPCNFDLIYDGTMNNTKSYIPLIKLLRELGYKIYVVYVDNVPKDEIVERALNRYKNSGRFVPLEVIDDFFEKGKTALNEIKEQADGYMIVDGSSNDYEIIEEGGFKLPQNREYSVLGRELQDYDKAKSIAFAKGGDISDKIRILKKEGYPQKQAVAIALDMKDRGKFEKGGETNFNPDGAMKGKVVHSSGEVGGMLVGKRHSEGGIKAINKSTGQPLEMEGGEVVITRNAVSDPKKRSFNGKMMTNREILSSINESGGGVSFADGGELPNQVTFDCEANYEFGGENMCGKDLAFAMGGTVTTAIVTDPNEAMADLQSTYGFGDVYAKGGVVVGGVIKNNPYQIHSINHPTIPSYYVIIQQPNANANEGYVYALFVGNYLPDTVQIGGKIPKFKPTDGSFVYRRVYQDRNVIGGFPYESNSTYFVINFKKKIINYFRITDPDLMKGVIVENSDYPTISVDFVSALNCVWFSYNYQFVFGDNNPKPPPYVIYPKGLDTHKTLKEIWGKYKDKYNDRKVTYDKKYVWKLINWEDEPEGATNRNKEYSVILRKDYGKKLDIFKYDTYVTNKLFNPTAPVVSSVTIENAIRNETIICPDFNYLLEYMSNRKHYGNPDDGNYLDKGYESVWKFRLGTSYYDNQFFTSEFEGFPFDTTIYLRFQDSVVRRNARDEEIKVSFKTLQKNPERFIDKLLRRFFNQLEESSYGRFYINSPACFNMMPFMVGDSDEAKKFAKEREEKLAQEKLKLKEERDAQKILDTFVFQNFPKINENVQQKLEKLQNEEKQLASLLPFFQGVNNSYNRIRILKELRKNYLIQSEIKLKPEEGFATLPSSFLLDYYYNQTTQSPVVSLDKPSKLPTPTGEPSKLPIGAYTNVRQKQFKEWFGYWDIAYVDDNYSNCSKCVNPETAEPEIFYHGVRKFNKLVGTSAFGRGISRPYGAFTPTNFPASYFSPNLEYAKFYSGQDENLPSKGRSAGFIYPVFLNIRNPLDFRPLGFKASYRDFLNFVILSIGVKIQPTDSVLKIIDYDINKKYKVWAFIRNDERIIEIFKNAGIDGIIQEGDVPVYDKSGKEKPESEWLIGVEYLTFYPNQVKSVSVKKSMYSALFDDIRFKKGGNVSI